MTNRPEIRFAAESEFHRLWLAFNENLEEHVVECANWQAWWASDRIS